MWSGDNVPTIGNTFGNPSYSAVVHTTYVISPTLLNEALSTTTATASTSSRRGLSTPKIRVHLQPLFTGPNAGNRIPDINLNGQREQLHRQTGCLGSTRRTTTRFRDDISWTKGAHQLKMGFSWALYKKISEPVRQHTQDPGTNSTAASPATTLPTSCWATASATTKLPSRQRPLEQRLYGLLTSRTTGACQPPLTVEPGPALGWRSAHLRSQQPVGEFLSEPV
jgi:hypothetical protein